MFVVRRSFSRSVFYVRRFLRHIFSVYSSSAAAEIRTYIFVSCTRALFFVLYTTSSPHRRPYIMYAAGVIIDWESTVTRETINNRVSIVFSNYYATDVVKGKIIRPCRTTLFSAKIHFPAVLSRRKFSNTIPFHLLPRHRRRHPPTPRRSPNRLERSPPIHRLTRTANSLVFSPLCIIYSRIRTHTYRCNLFGAPDRRNRTRCTIIYR